MLLDQTGFSKYNWNFPTGQGLDRGNLVKHHVWWKKGVKPEPSLNKCLAVNMLSFLIWNVLCWSEALQERCAWVLVASPSENKSKTGGNFSNCTAFWDDGFMRNIKKVSRQAQRLISLQKPDFANIYIYMWELCRQPSNNPCCGNWPCQARMRPAGPESLCTLTWTELLRWKTSLWGVWMCIW